MFTFEWSQILLHRGHNGVRSCIDCLQADVSDCRIVSDVASLNCLFSFELKVQLFIVVSYFILGVFLILLSFLFVFLTFVSLLQVMPRLRVGISRPTGKTSVERHVLGRFSTEEQKVLDSVLVQSVDLLISQLSQQDSKQDPQSSSSSPAGGRHAAQKTNKRERSSSPAEDSAAAAQSWSSKFLNSNTNMK